MVKNHIEHKAFKMKKTILFIVTSIISSVVFAQTQDTAFTSNSNPIITHKYTADPAALVYKDKLYLYTGHDVAKEKDKARYVMHDWLCFSTSDMKTLDRTSISFKCTKAFKWAKDDAWASQVVERNGKFYWYVAISHDSTQ